MSGRSAAWRASATWAGALCCALIRGATIGAAEWMIGARTRAARGARFWDERSPEPVRSRWARPRRRWPRAGAPPRRRAGGDGAGLSGLAAARVLAAAGRRARARGAGPRGWTHAQPPDRRRWRGRGRGRVWGRPKTGFSPSRGPSAWDLPVYNQGSNVEIVGGRAGPCTPPPPGFPPIARRRRSWLTLLSQIDPIAKEVGATAPWRAKRAKQLESDTLAEFRDRSSATGSARSSKP